MDLTTYSAADCDTVAAPKNKSFRKVFCLSLYFLWLFSLIQTNLTSIVGNKHIFLYMTLFLLPIFLFDVYKRQLVSKKLFAVNKQFCIATGLFVFAILLATPFTQHKVYNLGQAFKLTVIFTSYIILASDQEYRRFGFYAILGSAIINSFLVLIPILLQRELFFSHWSSGSRWATIMNDPGTLAITCSSIYVYALYLSFFSKQNKYKLLGAVLAVISLVGTVADNSRTFFLVMMFGTFYVLFLLKLHNGPKHHTIFFIKRVLPLLLIFILMLISINYSLSRISPARHSSRAVGAISSLVTKTEAGKPVQGKSAQGKSVQGKSVQDDSIRLKMLKTVVKNIKDHPWIGTGMTTSFVYMEAQKHGLFSPHEEVIHITYLQVWSDVGILAFIAFVLIALWWLIYFPKRLNAINRIDSVNMRAIQHNSIYLLASFAIMSLFHPINTSWDVWVFYLVSAAHFWNLKSAKQPHGSEN